MSNNKITEIPEEEFYEEIGYILSDLHSLSKEFEWYNYGNRTSLVKWLWNLVVNLPLVAAYFNSWELSLYSKKMFEQLEVLLEEISQKGKKIQMLWEDEKEKLVTFIKKELNLHAKKSSFEFPMKFREMLFVELGLDHVDDIWNIKEYTQFVVRKVMQK